MIDPEDVMFPRHLRRTSHVSCIQYAIVLKNRPLFSSGTGPDSKIKSIDLLELPTFHDFFRFFWLKHGFTREPRRSQAPRPSSPVSSPAGSSFSLTSLSVRPI